MDSTKTMEEAEALVQQMMVSIAGYKSVEMIDGESPLGLKLTVFFPHAFWFQFSLPNAGHEIHQVSTEKWYDPHQQGVGF